MTEDRCVTCRGELDTASRTRCRKCLAYMREYSRKKFGHQPWKPGGPGKPPIERGPHGTEVA